MAIVFIVNILVIALAVIIHYEFLYRITVLMPRLKIRHRFRIVLGVFLALTAHAAEVWVFAISFYLMNKSQNWGTLEGNFDGSLWDCAYFSFTTFTTLGFGDIQPMGDLRFLTGLESLTGLVLITWTASFLYLEMTRYWNEN
ncbi:MAG: potassium channel family protein [Halioglobus sp.]|nr:potassium channel family protein [Halioglobus sp.]